LDREEPARGRLDTGRIEGVEAEELGHRRGPRGWECSSTVRRRAGLARPRYISSRTLVPRGLT